MEKKSSNMFAQHIVPVSGENITLLLITIFGKTINKQYHITMSFL